MAKLHVYPTTTTSTPSYKTALQTAVVPRTNIHVDIVEKPVYINVETPVETIKYVDRIEYVDRVVEINVPVETIKYINVAAEPTIQYVDRIIVQKEPMDEESKQKLKSLEIQLANASCQQEKAVAEYRLVTLRNQKELARFKKRLIIFSALQFIAGAALLLLKGI